MNADIARFGAMMVHKHRISVAFSTLSPPLAVNMMIHASRWRLQRFAVTGLAGFSAASLHVNWVGEAFSVFCPSRAVFVCVNASAEIAGFLANL